MTDQEELQKDPQDSASGDDPITPAQAAYLETLSSQTGESVPDGMTKAAASEKIDQLRARVGGEEDRTEGDAAGNGEKHYRMLPIPPNSTR